MTSQPDHELSQLREALRDLIALFSVPAAWVDHEPAVVVNGLADALVALRDIEFAFVRLRDSTGEDVEASRGSAWPGFAEWLDDRGDAGGDWPGDSTLRTLAIPIGIDAAAGLVAVASRRAGFPAEIDSTMLTIGVNQAATAFQNACLIRDRRRAESDLRQTRDELAREQLALQSIASLVAADSSPHELVAIVAEQVARILDVPLVRLLRFEPDGSEAELIGGWGESIEPLATGIRWKLDETAVLAETWETGKPARREDYTIVQQRAGAVVRQAGMRSVVACPINVDGRLWGAIAVCSPRHESLPLDTEARLAHFTELAAAAVANAGARRELKRSAAEQDALRRAAILVASGASPPEIFAAITTSTSELFGVPFASLLRYGADRTATMVAGCAACSGFVGQAWTVPDDDRGIVRKVVSSRRPERVDDHSGVHGPLAQAASALGIGSVVGAPVIVDGSVWGVLAVGAAQDGPPLPANAGDRLIEFTELVTTTLTNAEARDEVRSLLHEQETLRRLATLIAEGAGPEIVFTAVCDEAVALFGAEQSAVVRVEDEATLEVVGLSAAIARLSAGMGGFTVGMRAAIGEWPTTSAAIRGGCVARNDVTAEHATGVGPIPDLIRAAGFLSTISAPIYVDGHVWGAMVVSDSRHALSGTTERRMVSFTDLIATAISNREARDQVVRSEARARELADEQAALRRVATLVAAGIEPDELFATVSDEVAQLFGANGAGVGRYERDGSGVVSVGTSEGLRSEIPLGLHQDLETSITAGEVYRTGLATRVELRNDEITSESRLGELAQRVVALGFSCVVAAPIVVGRELWGLMTVSTSHTRLPPNTEKRLESFAELIAIAVANAESRAALATSEARAHDLANEQAALRRVATLVAQGASPDDVFSIVAEEVAGIVDIPVVGICRSEADGTSTLLGIAGDTSLSVGGRWPDTADPTMSMLAVPIVIEGSDWGFMVAVAKAGRPIPGGTEDRLVRFTEMVATAVSNASARTELLSSRARLVTTSDATRRRLERDLHDGIQQWLVALALRARKASGLTSPEEPLTEELSALADDLVAVTDELREISRGIHPAILSDAGLDEALAALARRSAIPIDLDTSFGGRYHPSLEATVYYVVAESITNVAKHAQAATVAVRGGLRGDAIEVEITDDGVGGADPRRGSGLIGLKDRVDTLGGTIWIVSPAGSGTTIQLRLPALPSVETPSSRPSEGAVSAPVSG